jgi:signal transduction histidine kinase
VHAFPTADGLTIYFRNITRRKRAEEVQQFLARASDELAGSIDYRETLERVTRLAVPHLAEMSMVYVAEGRGELRRAAVSHVDPAKQAELDELLHGSPLRPHATASPVMRALLTGEAQLVSEVTEAELEAYATSPDHQRVLQRLAPRSLIVVPLISRGRTLGAITLGCGDEQRRYTEDDVAVARELARRAALAIDNARLYADAQQASRARHEILHVVSHDLRNSLHAMLLNLDMLLADTPDVERRTRSRPEMEAIQRSALQMERLVRDLLDAENLETGRFAVHLGVVHASEMIEDTLELLQPLAAERSLALRAAVAPGLPLLRADPSRLQQVLVNLIGNAIKFTGPGGEVVVAAEPGAEPDRVRLAVTDTGVGIGPEELPLVFDRYWQGEQSRRSGRGTGLGLAITRGIVEAHGGEIGVQSRVGHGTTVHITLPAIA